jgi:hypothetical protein
MVQVITKAQAKQAATAAVEAAVAANTLVEFAQGIGCPVVEAGGRLGVRKWQLEAALHNAYNGTPMLDVAAGFKACDPVAHYMVGITEGLGRDARVDSQRVVVADANGRERASTHYFNRAGEVGTRVGGYSAGPSKGQGKELVAAKTALADAVLGGGDVEAAKAKVTELLAKPKASSGRVAALEQQLAAQAEQLAKLMALLQAK